VDRRSSARSPADARRARSGALVVLLALASVGCASSETITALERPRVAATARLRERGRPSAEADDLAERAERDAVVALALARSPSIGVLAHRARALVHAGRAEAALPAAELGLSAWNLPLARPYAAGEADMYMVELRQRFPAAGSRDARGRAMAEEAEALLAELSAEERLVAERALEAYADYVEASEARALQRRQQALLERVREGVRARYSTGGSALADAARVEIELAKSRRALARVDGDVARARSSLNALLRRPASAPLAEPAAGPAETIRLPIDELLARAASKRGPVLAAGARARAAEARREAADAEAHMPEIMIGIGYWQVPKTRPGVGLTASMSLPWLWGPGRERSAQAHEEERAAASERDAAAIGAQAEVTEAHARLAALEAQLLVLRREALPAARRSVDAIAAAYTTGGASLLDWVDAARSALDLEVEANELRAGLARGAAALERAVGAPLPRAPLAVEADR
jgi:outer membrane protein TolC